MPKKGMKGYKEEVSDEELAEAIRKVYVDDPATMKMLLRWLGLL